MTNRKLCTVCGGMGVILDSNGGSWTCPKCSGYGMTTTTPKADPKLCPEHSVEMKWEGLETGYWVCHVKH